MPVLACDCTLSSLKTQAARVDPFHRVGTDALLLLAIVETVPLMVAEDGSGGAEEPEVSREDRAGTRKASLGGVVLGICVGGVVSEKNEGKRYQPHVRERPIMNGVLR